MTRFRRSLTASAVVLGLLATSASAFADGGRRYGGWDKSARHHRVEPAPHYRGHQHGNYGHKKRDNTAKAVILGMSAVILGAILSEAVRNERREYLNDH
jgi:hypothetical protein